MNTKMLLSVAGAVASTLFLASAHGQGISINIDLAGEPGDQVFTAGTSDSPLVSGVIVDRGPGIGSTTAVNSISSNGWDSLNAAEDFFSLRFTVAPGESIDMQSLVIGTRASNTGPGDLGLFYSGDGFTSNLYTFTQSGTSFLNSEVDLTSLTGVSGEVEFRVIALSDTRADGATGIAPGGTLRLTNFFDGGDTGGITFTAIPEPSTYAALFGLLALAVVGLRRRMKR